MSYLQMQQQSNFFHGFPKNDQRINLPKHLCHLYICVSCLTNKDNKGRENDLSKPCFLDHATKE